MKKNFIYLKPCFKCQSAGVVKCLYAEHKFLFYTHCVGCGYDAEDSDTIDGAKEFWNNRKEVAPADTAETAADTAAKTEKPVSPAFEADEMRKTFTNQKNEAASLLNDILNIKI